MNVKYTNLDWLSVFCLGLFSLFLLLFYIDRPVYNHDLSGYLGVVLSYEESDPDVIHADVFERLKAGVPPHRFERLVGAAVDSAPAVRILGQDPEAFRQSLPFYEVRIVYTGLIYLLSKVGVDPIFASHAISAVSVFFCLWIFAFLFKGIPPFPYLLFLPLIALGIGLHEIARLSSPDALGLFAWSLAFFFFLRHRNATLILFPLIVLIRTDYILFILIILLYLFFSKSVGSKAIVTSMVASLGAYLGVNYCYDGYSLITALNYSYHYGQVAYPETTAINFGLRSYLELLVGALSSAHSPESRGFYLFLVFAGLSCFLIWRAIVSSEVRLRSGLYDLGFLLIGGFAYIVGHVILVPRFDDRYFAFLYMLAPCVLVVLITSHHPTPTRRSLSLISRNYNPSPGFDFHLTRW